MGELTDDPQQRVTFTVKELLNRIDGKLDTMAIAIAAKAETAVVERLIGRVETLEATDKSNRQIGELYLAEYNAMKNDVRTLKDGAVTQASLNRYKRWLLATTIAAIGASSGFVVIALKAIIP